MERFAIYAGGDSAKTLRANADAWLSGANEPKTLVVLEARRTNFEMAIRMHAAPRPGSRFVGIVGCDADTFQLPAVQAFLKTSRDVIRLSVDGPSSVPEGLLSFVVE